MSSISRSLLSLATSYLNLSFAFASPSVPEYTENAPFNWTAISPSPDLTYHKCYGHLECARLEVPLDWSNLSNPNKVVLAIARLPAVVNVSDPSFGGTIILNPGGPSGSGITLINERGPWLQPIVDEEKHYELLSFDPRGVYHTTPSTACFGDDLSRQAFNLKKSTIGFPDTSRHAYNSKWAAYEALGILCSDKEVSGYADGSNIRNYASTVLVARDMVAIVDKVDEHLKKSLKSYETGSMVAATNPDVGQHVLDLGDNANKSVPLMNYWGFSYGTILGNFFATLHPDRIGRLLLDGVADVNDYLDSPGWTSNLQNSDEALETLYQHCFEGGERCPLFNKSDACPSSIKERLNAFLDNLRDNPIPVVYNGTADLITYDYVRQQIFDALYSPVVKFPGLAQILSDLLAGNTTSMIPKLPKIDFSYDQGKAQTEADVDYSPLDVDEPIPPQVETYAHQTEAMAAILCGDGDPMSSITKSEFGDYLATLKSQSSICGGVWADLAKLVCVNWPASLRPTEENRFRGPFVSSASQYDVRGSPILFIGNTLDNVTPLRNAHKMAKGHEGSVVLTLVSAGHCSVFSSPSKCTRKVIRKYFATGELPEIGTVCKGERVPWDGKGVKSRRV